jgi:acyl carrier protein
MTTNEFLRSLEVQMEIPPGSLHENQTLADLDGWDSMAALLFIALADEKLGITVVGNDIATAKTVGDLLARLGDRLAT